MSNLSAALEGASQGLDQLAEHANQREMMEAQMMRAENLAQLRNYLTTHRELLVTSARGQVLKDVSASRTADEHAARDEEIDRQESGRARNQATAQHQQLIDTEAAQDNAFTNQGELQARTGDRAARAQASRDAMLQANQARQQKAQIRGWLLKYQQKSLSNGTVSLNDAATGGSGPLDAQQLAELARHDSVLASQLQAYKEADAREQAATRAMGKFPRPSDTPSMPGAVAPARDPLTSPPTSSLIPIPSEGPGVSDQPYPSGSGAGDEIGLSDSTSSASNSGASDDEDDGSGS